MDSEERQAKLLLGINSLKTGAKLVTKCVNLYNSFKYIDDEQGNIYDSDYESAHSDSDYESTKVKRSRNDLEKVYRKQANALNSAAKLKIKESEALRKIAQAEENEKQKLDDRISILEKKKFQAIEVEDYKEASKIKRKINFLKKKKRNSRNVREFVYDKFEDLSGENIDIDRTFQKNNLKKKRKERTIDDIDILDQQQEETVFEKENNEDIEKDNLAIPHQNDEELVLEPVGSCNDNLSTNDILLNTAPDVKKDPEINSQEDMIQLFDHELYTIQKDNSQSESSKVKDSEPTSEVIKKKCNTKILIKFNSGDVLDLNNKYLIKLKINKITMNSTKLNLKDLSLVLASSKILEKPLLSKIKYMNDSNCIEQSITVTNITCNDNYITLETKNNLSNKNLNKGVYKFFI